MKGRINMNLKEFA